MKKTMYIFIVFLLSAASAYALEGKDITFTPANAAPVVFSHNFHTKMRGVKCAACHFQSFSVSGNSFQMKKEKMTKRDFCEHCHNGMKSFDANAQKNCSRCHKKP